MSPATSDGSMKAPRGGSLGGVCARDGSPSMAVSVGPSAQFAEASSMFSSSRAFSPTRNTAAFSDDKFTQMVTVPATEPDPAKRKALYSQINDYILDQAFILPLSLYPNLTATKASVHDLSYDLVPRLNLTDVWVD